MKYIANEQLERFFSKIDKKYHRDDFYDLFLDYLDEEGIEIFDKDDEDELENEVFSIAKQRGIIGYDVVQEITDMEIFQEKMNILTKRNQFTLYHFFYEIDNDISTSAFWNKWNQLPPLGWVGGWCNCGNFYPNTFDMCEMNLEEDQYTRVLEDNRPRTIHLHDIESVLICNDSFFRLKLNNGKIIAVRPYKFESGFAFNFMDNPLDLLK